MARTWNRTTDEDRIRRGRRWDALTSAEREAIWGNRTFFALLGAKHDDIKGGSMTVEQAAKACDLGDFRELASEVARSMSPADPHRANKAFPNRDIIATDPDDARQWRGWKKYVIGRAKNIVLPARVHALGLEASAVRESARSDSDAHGRTKGRGRNYDDLAFDPGVEHHLEGFGFDGFNAAAVVREFLDLDGASARLDAAIVQESKRGPRRGARLWDDAIGDKRWYSPREVVEVAIAEYRIDTKLDIFVVVNGWEKATGKTMTAEHLTRVCVEIERERQKVIAKQDIFLASLMGTTPEDDDFNRRLICGPEFIGTGSGRDRHRDKVAQVSNPLRAHLGKARTALRAAERGGDDAVMSRASAAAVEASGDYIEAIEYAFGYRQRLPGIPRPEASHLVGDCDECNPPRVCTTDGCTTMFKAHGNQRKCGEHKRPPKLAPEAIYVAEWVESGASK